MNKSFEKFDPLSIKYNGNEEVVIQSLKREIINILNSYVGWYDPFCEMIQNSLDAIDKRSEEEEFNSQIHILINLRDNMISVTDNGIGFKEEEYLKFLAPNFSFKSNGLARGHKGVGATYLAYGFNYIQIATKTQDFSAVGVMKNAKKWLEDPAPASNPYVIDDNNKAVDVYFEGIDRGTSVTIKCDSSSYPKDLSWIGLTTASSWMKVLRVQTGLGQIKNYSEVKVIVDVIDKTGKTTTSEMNTPTYLSLEEFSDKVKTVDDINKKMDELYRKVGPNYKMPSKYSNLEGIYGKWDCETLLSKISFNDSEIALLKQYNVSVIFSYVYSLSVWEKIDKIIGIRKGSHVLYGGIQLAANNMPQGDLIQIPLTKNIGRQKQANIVVHFDNCSADLGRKGFKKENVDLGKEISRKLMDGPLMKVRFCFKANSGAAPDLKRESILAEWKAEMSKHEHDYPLVLENPNFFDPVKKISITSMPTREQDVIALFNQLIAGGVIRGIKIMSTNERMTYDSLYKIIITNTSNLQLYDRNTNPLGIVDDIFSEMLADRDEFVSEPKVLEYKYSLDGLIEDIESGIKNTSDINLVVAWEAGEHYKNNYNIESLLIGGNEIMRQYHGITHRLHSINANEFVCDLILLKDLVLFLNNTEESVILQDSYDD